MNYTIILKECSKIHPIVLACYDTFDECIEYLNKKMNGDNILNYEIFDLCGENNDDDVSDPEIINMCGDGNVFEIINVYDENGKWYEYNGDIYMRVFENNKLANIITDEFSNGFFYPCQCNFKIYIFKKNKLKDLCDIYKIMSD